MQTPIWLETVLAEDLFRRIASATVILLAGLIVAQLLRKRAWRSQAASQQHLLIKRILIVLVLGISGTWSLHLLGVDLSVLLGTAGVLTVALGFASQTSASNIISGLFLMTEKPFAVGEIVTVDGITGEVIAIDLLSVKLRKFDNTLVRIPNETMLKSNLENLTRFPIRRVDVLVSVAYKESIGAVREILSRVANKNPLCLEEPAPILFFLAYGASGIDLKFSVWVATENYVDFKNAIHEEIKDAFDTAGIEIPFPHVSLYAGTATAPIPVRIEQGNDS